MIFVFMLFDFLSGCFPFLPETLRPVAKESDGSHSALRGRSVMQRPDRAGRLQPGNYFGASKAKQKPPRGEA